MTEQVLDTNQQIQERRNKLNAWREQGKAFPNQFKREQVAADLHQGFDELSKEALAEKQIPAVIAGRIMTRRVMGKASFATLQDMSGRIQIYVSKNDLGDADYEAFTHFDLGDIVGVTGVLMKTKTGELSVHASSVELLTKALRPLPDKYHGLTDQEQRFRQRYLDLIANSDVRDVFQKRSQIVAGIRRFLDGEDFMEVETPMMHSLAGGAAAKPFTTHHNALDMPLFLRIAPELYLKRLVVGGFEKVYEVNRNFRNEGVSTRHNPEFTMLEFYWAYADYRDLMAITEKLFKYLAETVMGDTTIHYQGEAIDLSQPFAKMTVVESICHHEPSISADDLKDMAKAKAICEQYSIKIEPSYGLGKVQMEIFDALVEDKLIQPTFITAFPTEVSPLARKNDDDDFVTDRFELYAGGREIANGFSELNDPEDQAERFKAQVAAKAAGDDEAMAYDEDYITALEHGLPPTAGEGIGIDRLVMLFTDRPSIRDVILFPLLRHK